MGLFLIFCPLSHGVPHPPKGTNMSLSKKIGVLNTGVSVLTHISMKEYLFHLTCLTLGFKNPRVFSAHNRCLRLLHSVFHHHLEFLLAVDFPILPPLFCLFVFHGYIDFLFCDFSKAFCWVTALSTIPSTFFPVVALWLLKIRIPLERKSEDYLIPFPSSSS